MLEQETDTILRALVDRTLGTRASIRLGEVMDADIPTGIGTFLHAEVIGWLGGDLASSAAFAHIDYLSPGVDELSRSFLGALARAYVFTRDEYVTSLENAVLFLENYLCRPRWTLENFVFEERARIPIDVLHSKLAYLSEYTYFARAIERLATHRGWTEMSNTDFRSLVARIDDEVIRQHTPRELTLLTKPIFDFLLYGCPTAETAIAPAPVLLFFEDKGMTALKDHVEGVCRMRGAERLSLAELGVLIEDIDVVREERKEPAVEEPLTQDTPAPPVEPVLPPARPAINPALSLTYAGMVDSQQGLPDLNTLFSAEQRREFIERIFKQDSNHFASVIEALNNTLTWRDAALYLNRYFHVNGIDPLSKDVAGFSDVVQRRFTAEHTGSA